MTVSNDHIGIFKASRLRRQVAILVLAGAGYYLVASLSYSLALQDQGIVVVWFPSGLLLAILLLIDRREWPLAIAAAVAGNVTADIQQGSTLGLALAAGAANAIESTAAAWLLSRFVRAPVALATVRETGAFLLAAPIVSNAATALVGGLVQAQGRAHGFWYGWFLWWVGDGLGMLAVAPPILTIASLIRRHARIGRWRALEAVVVLAGVGALAQYALALRPHAGVADPLFIVFPLLIWMAIRFEPPGGSLAVLVLSLAMAWSASRHPGVFGAPGSPGAEQAIDMYAYLGLAALTTLIPAAVFNERKIAEEDLRESEGRFRQIADHAGEAFYVLEFPQGGALYASPAWSRIWGRPVEQAGDPSVWVEAVHPDDRAALADSMAAVRRGEPSMHTLRIIRPDGTTRWVRRQLFPVRDDRGNVYRAAGLSEDVTETRLTLSRMSQSEKMNAIGQLAGGVAHDFNNLLTVILSYSEMVLEDPALPASHRADIEAVRRAGEIATGLTRQLLAFSRQDVPQPQELHLNERVRATGQMLQRLLGEHVELAMALEAVLDIVLADSGQMEQVIVNLAVNARDAMPEGGKLLIETRNVEWPTHLTGTDGRPPSGPCVMLAVSDTGVGMDAETQARVFEPFFTTKAKGKGTGLGLSTVYGIVQQGGGHVSLYSEPGQGTTFKIYLPGAVDPVAPGAASSQAGVKGGTESVLVVEDDPFVLGAVRDSLSSLGYRVTALPDGRSALDWVTQHDEPIHLVITDLVMPGMSGRALADNLLALWPARKILFMSGYTDDAVVRHDVLESRRHFIQKPFAIEALARKVRQVLDG